MKSTTNQSNHATNTNRAKNNTPTESIVKINGLEFASLHDACDFYEQDIDVVLRKLAQGANLHDALNAPVFINYIEEDSSNASELSQSHNGAKAQTNESSVTSSEKDALYNKTYTVNGKAFHSLEALSLYFHVPLKIIEKRLQNGATVEEAVGERAPKIVININNDDHSNQVAKKDSVTKANKTKNKAKKRELILMDGIAFTSKKKVAEHYRIPLHQFYARLKNGETIRQAVNLDVSDRLIGDMKKVADKQKKTSDVFYPIEFPLHFDNKEFKNYSQIAKHYNISSNKFFYELYHGYGLSEIVGIKPKPLQARKRTIEKRQFQKVKDLLPIVINGKVYNSISDLAKSYGIDNNKLIGRLRNFWSIEEALGLVERKSPRKKATNAKSADKKQVTIEQTKKSNKTIEASSLNVTEPVVFDGKKYDSLLALLNELEISQIAFNQLYKENHNIASCVKQLLNNKQKHKPFVCKKLTRTINKPKPKEQLNLSQEIVVNGFRFSNIFDFCSHLLIEPEKALDLIAKGQSPLSLLQR
jgi:hypothetical protein